MICMLSTLLSLGLVDGAQEVLEVVGLVLQKIYLLRPLLILRQLLLLNLLLQGLLLLF